jgi:hypothetical protein
MRIQITPKTVRRLLSADGYLDLGMPRQAIQELGLIQDAGVLEGPRELLFGIALKQVGDNPAAIHHLEKAARLMPSPIRRFAWRELEGAYRAVGSEELAGLAHKLAGDGKFELRIQLPNSNQFLNIPVGEKSP